jgi:hypothetical protein
MLNVNYENPDGVKRHNQLWNGGFASGSVTLYKKIKGSTSKWMTLTANSAAASTASTTSNSNPQSIQPLKLKGLGFLFNKMHFCSQIYFWALFNIISAAFAAPFSA